MSHVALPPANVADLKHGCATPIEGCDREDLFDFMSFTPKACYNNAAKVMLGNMGEGLRYVLGYICTGDITRSLYIAHAWIETDDGLILDPTLDLATIDDEPRGSDGYIYFPLVTFTGLQFGEILEALDAKLGAMYAPDHDNLRDFPLIQADLAVFEACDGLTRMIDHVGNEDLGWDQDKQRFTKKREGTS